MDKKWEGTWPFEERSTRNCVHCKTKIFQDRPRVYCSKGLPLTKRCSEGDPDYSMSLPRVLVTAHFLSEACESCLYFEHDNQG